MRLACDYVLGFIIVVLVLMAVGVAIHHNRSTEISASEYQHVIDMYEKKPYKMDIFIKERLENGISRIEYQHICKAYDRHLANDGYWELSEKVNMGK